MKLAFKISAIIILLATALFFLYLNNTSLVDPRTADLYSRLGQALRSRGYADRLLVISTKRTRLHNQIQVKLNGAATRSRHLDGEAIDFLVLDVNRDGSTDSKDVKLVYDILDKELMKGTGGIGTYMHESSFFNRQMIHIDCRKTRGRWSR